MKKSILFYKTSHRLEYFINQWYIIIISFLCAIS